MHHLRTAAIILALSASLAACGSPPAHRPAAAIPAALCARIREIAAQGHDIGSDYSGASSQGAVAADQIWADGRQSQFGTAASRLALIAAARASAPPALSAQLGALAADEQALTADVSAGVTPSQVAQDAAALASASRELGAAC